MNNERVALAQELHDGIAQDLVALGFSIDAQIAVSHSADEKAYLRELRFTITTLINKVRTEIHTLRLDQQPIETVEESNFSYELQRIFLEIVRNVEKHSRASTLSIEVTDDGVGGAVVKEGSFGLSGIQERTKKLNGEIQIDSNTDGTKIRITIPLDR